MFTVLFKKQKNLQGKKSHIYIEITDRYSVTQKLSSNLIPAKRAELTWQHKGRYNTVYVCGGG